MDLFTIEPHDYYDKEFLIEGPIQLFVDYDDVDHQEQNMLAKKVVEILNKHWEQY